MYTIDFNGINTIEEFHKRVREGIRVPEYYGDNLDALADILSEMDGRILIRGTEAIDQDMDDYMDRFRAMCLDMQQENRLLEIVFS